MQCPHGGTVQAVASNTRATAGGAPILTSADTFLVVGCPFQLPTTPPTPSPCVKIQWIVTDIRVKTASGQTLSNSSVGLCSSAAGVPQGPVVIQSTQPFLQSI
ncbi:MAG: hypothetical protein WBV94_23850 [Blastocatellia bacterium]